MPQAEINNEADYGVSSGTGDANSGTPENNGSGSTQGSSSIGSGEASGGNVSEGRQEKSSQNKVSNNLSDSDLRMIVGSYVEDALDQNIFSVNSFAIKEDYPLSYAKMVEYMIQRTRGEQEVDDQVVAGALMYTPRIVLPDFFDDYDFPINFEVKRPEGIWKYTISHVNGDVEKSGASFTLRVKAEAAAYENAFELLEAKLNSKP